MSRGYGWPPREQAKAQGMLGLGLGGVHCPVGLSCFPLQRAQKDTPRLG